MLQKWQKPSFWQISSKIFFRSLRKLRNRKKNFDKLCKKMAFIIFKAKLDFNHLCPFLKFKTYIIQKIELWKKIKYAQNLVLYSSINI